MSLFACGKTLIIANPASRSGRGAEAAHKVAELFGAAATTQNYELYLTHAPHDATQRAASAIDFDTVCAVGGDGLVHEVIAGLMRISEDIRPRFALIPMGSGNDFARTLALKKNDPHTAFDQLMHGRVRACDLGWVNGIYFAQTLSFGLDAAIALDTSVRRAHNSAQHGAGLFATSGIKILSHNLTGWPVHMVCDGEEIDATDIIFAIQNGPTYGGGFKVCPDAQPDDGKLNLCYSVKRPTAAHALALFARARVGKHTHSPVLKLRSFTTLELDFPEGTPPCQVDGEPLTGSHFSIRVEPHVLNVVVPQ
ncbi:MAG: diacylglycerol/lipid kinase family protein [Atopobiaceae bacterium]|jgi:YegS/Rv2252/BmrU family lipid kinase